jgi:hypothetical protein
MKNSISAMGDEEVEKHTTSAITISIGENEYKYKFMNYFH